MLSYKTMVIASFDRMQMMRSQPISGKEYASTCKKYILLDDYLRGEFLVAVHLNEIAPLLKFGQIDLIRTRSIHPHRRDPAPVHWKNLEGMNTARSKQTNKTPFKKPNKKLKVLAFEALKG